MELKKRPIVVIFSKESTEAWGFPVDDPYNYLYISYDGQHVGYVGMIWGRTHPKKQPRFDFFRQKLPLICQWFFLWQQWMRPCWLKLQICSSTSPFRDSYNPDVCCLNSYVLLMKKTRQCSQKPHVRWNAILVSWNLDIASNPNFSRFKEGFWQVSTRSSEDLGWVKAEYLIPFYQCKAEKLLQMGLENWAPQQQGINLPTFRQTHCASFLASHEISVWNPINLPLTFHDITVFLLLNSANS